jgi:hypothetical protein
VCGVVAIDVTLNIDNNGKKLRLDTYIAEKCNISRSKAQRLIQATNRQSLLNLKETPLLLFLAVLKYNFVEALLQL